MAEVCVVLPSPASLIGATSWATGEDVYGEGIECLLQEDENNTRRSRNRSTSIVGTSGNGSGSMATTELTAQRQARASNRKESKKVSMFAKPSGSTRCLSDQETKQLYHNLERRQRFLSAFSSIFSHQRNRKSKMRMTVTNTVTNSETSSQATSTTASTCSDDSCSSLQSEEFEEAPLIERRLLQTGIVKSVDEFELVPDYVSKEVIGLYDEDDKKQFDELHRDVVSHVKTGVWEVQCFRDDGTPKDPFYVVTGVSMDDRVDTKKLRRAIFSGQAGQPNTRRPKLGLAATEIGEKLTGFTSGTMMPICHTTNMKLYLEETIAQHRHDPNHRILCGSGIFGKCLSIPTETFLQIAEASPLGVTACPIIQKKKIEKQRKPTT